MIRTHYPELFADDPGDARARRRAGRDAPTSSPISSPTCSSSSSVPGRFAGTVTYHDCCAGLREMGVKAQPRALLAKVPGVHADGDGRAARPAAASAARSRSSSARSRRASPTTSASTSTHSGADAVVLGDLGCMLNIEGRLRRRGDTKTRCCTSPKCSPGEARASDASRLDALQGARARQAQRRAAAEATSRRSRPSSSPSAGSRSSSSTTSRARARPARAIRQRALDNLDIWLEMFERNATARGATVPVRADAGGGQRARARHRARARRAQDHQVEVDGLRGVRRSTTPSRRPG